MKGQHGNRFHTRRAKCHGTKTWTVLICLPLSGSTFDSPRLKVHTCPAGLARQRVALQGAGAPTQTGWRPAPHSEQTSYWPGRWQPYLVADIQIYQKLFSRSIIFIALMYEDYVKTSTTHFNFIIQIRKIVEKQKEIQTCNTPSAFKSVPRKECNWIFLMFF